MLPQKQYLPIVLGKPSAALGQIVKRNNEYAGSDISLSQSEIQALTSLSQQLEKYNFQGNPSLSTTPALESSLSSLLKIVTQWEPPSNRLAGLDLLRFIAAVAKEFPRIDADGLDAVASVLGSGIFDADFVRSNNKLAMIAVRFFSNALYGSPCGRELIGEYTENIIGSLKPLQTLVAKDVSVAIALTTLYVNLAVLVTTDTTGDADTNAAYGLSLMEESTRLLKNVDRVDHTASANPSSQSTEPAYRALVALGTVITGLKRSDLTDAAKEVFDVPGLIALLKNRKYLEEPRFRVVSNEILAALR